MRFPAILLAAACALILPGLARAAELRAVEVSSKPFYVEVALRFDKRPQYSESWRYGPDRYLLTFSGCKSAVPKDKAAALGKLDGGLLSRVSLYQGGADMQVGFYVNARTAPLIRYDDTAYYVRFCTNCDLGCTVQLGAGVSYIEKTVARADGNLMLYMTRIDPGAPVDLYSVAADRYDRKSRTRAPTSFARRENADVVINGGFFGAQGQHLSTLVEEGLMRATGVYPTRPMLVVTQDGEALLGRFNVVTALKFGGKALTINAKNYPFESGKTIVYDNTYPLETLPQNAMYYYTLTGGKLKFYSSDTKGLALAPGQLLLANDIMPEANPLRQIPDGTDVQLETSITDSGGNELLARSAIGGAPMLVEDGRVALSSDEDRVKDDIAKSERSRTAIAMTKSGALLLVVVREAEGAGYGGLTLKALAEALVAQGAQTAVNFDGGGSSAMVVAGDLVNEPESDQRPVSNVLVVKTR